MLLYDLASPEKLSFISALLLGLMGSVHCVGMCGGLASALSLPLSAGKLSQRKKLLIQFCFGVGRVCGYGLAGFLAGSFSWVLLNVVGSDFALVLRVVTGVLMIMLGLFLTRWWNGLAKIERIGAGLWQKISPFIGRLTPADTIAKALGIGFLWGWLPCGMVYSMLVFSLSSGSGVDGAVIMLMFGLGTIPAVVGLGVLAERTVGLLQHGFAKNFFGGVIILFGCWTIWGALGLGLHHGHG